MRKKILFVTNHFRFSNGVASVLRSLIDNINQTQFDIHLLTLYEFDNEFAKPIKNKATFHKGFGFYFRGFDKLTKFIPLKWLYKSFIKDRYDLEVAFQFGLPTKMMSVSDNPHKICWMHGYDTKMLLRQYYQKFNRIITVSQIGVHKLISDGFDIDKCNYCYNIIDEDVIQKMQNESIDIERTHKYVIITVGRQSVEKAGLRQLECIREIYASNPNCEFWIVGSGTEFPQMQTYVHDNNMEQYVKLLGQQNNPYKYMKAADLYFCGSTHEGFSTACQEAAIMGLPVISTKVDGADELIEEAGAGAVVENNKDGIISALSNILNNSNMLDEWFKTAEKNKIKFFKKQRIERIEKTLSSSSSC